MIILDNMNTSELHFKKLFDYSKRIERRYLHFLSAYRLYDEYNKLSAINKVGKKKAETNVKIFNKYKYFILMSKEALRFFFLIELSKFFDEDIKRRQTLCIQEIINYALKNIDSFSVEQFKKYHKDRKIIPQLFEKFKSLTKKDLNKILRRIKRNDDIILRLKNYRDKCLAHDDINQVNIIINKKDVSILMKIVKDTIDLMYSKLDFSVIIYDNYNKEPINDINNLIKDLVKQEKVRLSELEKKYGVKLPK